MTLERNLISKEGMKNTYKEKIERNIGYITWEEQEKLRHTKIAVLGVGGLGGPLLEQLVRSGCENLIIADWDTFDVSNLNRQLCDLSDLGKSKIEVLTDKMRAINPDVNIQKVPRIHQGNITEILKEVSVVALTLDDPITSILIARTCYEMGIPMLETWAVPYLCAWWFTPENQSYEVCYELNTAEMTIAEMRDSEEVQLEITKSLIPKVMQFPGFKERLDREPGILDKMLSGKIGLRSFGPIVRLSASYLAFEVIFSGVLEVKEKVLAPHVIGYDYFKMDPITFQF
jgi:molybdopterin/thiamine biosynthesis adenylyltransferase